MIIGFIVIGLIILIDQITKWLTVTYIGDDTIVIIRNFFNLVEHHNDGAGWSIFAGQWLFLILVTILSLGFFAYLFKSINFKTKWVYSLAVSFMIGGTLGNFIDRIRLRYVIDFLQFTFGNYTFPTFNVADSALTVGVILFAIDIFFLESKR